MKSTISRLIAISLIVLLTLSLSLSVSAVGYYTHDPMDNPKAAADIIVDPNAVYGYSPDPESPRLGSFADYDWSDEAFVAEMKQEREEYHESVKELYQIKADMEAAGSSVEDIARAVSARRNEIRMEAYKDDPEGLEKLKESNLAAFGNENGGTPEYFYEKYGSWETVIEKAFSTNAGADAILGLYDKYYDTYFINTDNEDETLSPSTDSTDNNTGATEIATSADQSTKSPNTGDNAVICIEMILIAAALAAISVTALSRRKQD